MEFNSDFRYDLKLGQESETKLAEIFKSSKVEVKRDIRAIETGNIFIEYECRGRPSGIAKTDADWYAIELYNTFVIIAVDKLKVLCRKYIGTKRDVLGGDKNTSKGIILPVKELI